jgi:hypothetical protein
LKFLFFNYYFNNNKIWKNFKNSLLLIVVAVLTILIIGIKTIQFIWVLHILAFCSYFSLLSQNWAPVVPQIAKIMFKDLFNRLIARKVLEIRVLLCLLNESVVLCKLQNKKYLSYYKQEQVCPSLDATSWGQDRDPS